MLALFLMAASTATPLNDCGGVGPWCIDARVTPEAADGYVAYMSDRSEETPGRFMAVVQTGGDASFSLSVGVWECDARAGQFVDGAAWSLPALETRVQRARDILERSVAEVAEKCAADPATFSSARETFADAYRVLEQGRPLAMTGRGSAPRQPGHDLRETLGFGPLPAEAWRLSIQPALGGLGRVVEATWEPEAETAIVTMATAMGSAQQGWTANGRWSFAIPADRFHALAAEVDAAMTEKDSGFVVCTDGPGYLAERRDDAEAVWRAGGCKGGTNDRLARSILALVREHLPDVP